MMYVHNHYLDNIDMKPKEEVDRFVADFNPLRQDEEFFENLYQRKLLRARLEKWDTEVQRWSQLSEEEKRSTEKPALMLNDLRFRHGLAPGAQNIRNVRHKVDPIVDKEKVRRVEDVLKSLIETGFADNCDEELLEFDEDGKLVKVTPGVTEDQRLLQQEVDGIWPYKGAGLSASEMDAASVSQTQSGIQVTRQPGCSVAG